jgi:hypothetical protein
MKYQALAREAEVRMSSGLGEPTAPDEEGLEIEGGPQTAGELPERIERPFDPLEIKISRRIVPVGLITRRIEFGEIELAPDFQRRARIWDIVRKSKLIESILLRIPLPVFYVAADEKENWRVVDGLQRLTTIYDFVHTETSHSFNLKGLEYLQAYEGANFDKLPRSIKRRIDETELNINVIESGTPDEVMFNVFKRINTGGITLNGQEIRHALNPGPARGFLTNLADSKELYEATDGSVTDVRMGARELALRFSAFFITPPSEYGGSDLDGFLNEAMKRLNSASEKERMRISDAFKVSMIRAQALFGNDAFRKRFPSSTSRSPINRALFEAWSVPLAKLPEDRYRQLLLKSAQLKSAFATELSGNPEFLASISVSTGDRTRVRERFTVVERIIKEILGA